MAFQAVPGTTAAVAALSHKQPRLHLSHSLPIPWLKEVPDGNRRYFFFSPGLTSGGVVAGFAGAGVVAAAGAPALSSVNTAVVRSFSPVEYITIGVLLM